MNDNNLWGLTGWSLIMGKGGATKPEGEGQVKFYSHKKWDRKGFSHPEGRAEKVCGSFPAEPFSNIKGGSKTFPRFKRGGGVAKTFTLSSGGCARSFGATIFPFCSAPLRVINDQSLNSQRIPHKALVMENPSANCNFKDMQQ